jgi:TP901 family phage tail tape measure protein
MSVNLGTAVGYLELNSDRWVSSYNTARQQMQTLADSSQSMSSRFQAAGQMLTRAGTTLTACVTVPLAGMGAASLKSAVDFESAFAGVRKTVDATKSQYKDLEDGIRSMSKQMPQSAAEIATVAESAGQLGIQRENVLSFTKVMVELGDTTNLSSEEAASALAQFANVTGMSMDNIDRLGSTIVALGNNLATTESAIVEMGQRMASTGSQIGMTEAQIMSWSGAMSSVGVSAEVGGSSFSKFAKDVQLAVETNSSQLSKFAKVAGMSSSEFSKAFKEDASGALQAFIKGLSESEEKGTSVTAVLDALGYTEVGMSQTLSSLAGGYGTLSKALDVGSESWKENTALSKEAETRYQTTESQLEILKNQFQDVGISIGQILLPTLQSLMSALSSFASYLASLDEGTLRIITTIGMVAASIGPVLLILGSLASAIGNLIELKALLAESSILSSAIGRVSGLFTSLRNVIMGSVVPALQSLWAFMLTNPITFVIAAIAALVAGFVYLWNNCESFRNFWINLWDNIVSTVSKIPGQVQKIFNELPGKIGTALGTALGTIASWIVNTWNYFTTNIPKWIESIGQWFSELPGKIGTWLTNTYNNVISWGSNMLSKAIETGTNFVNNVVNFIKNLPTTVYNWLTQTYNKVVNWATQMINKAREVGSNFVSKVGSTIQSLPGKVWSYLSQTISKAVTFVSQFGQKATQAARNFTTNIVNGVRNIPNQMLSIGRNIVQGIWRGISGAAGWLRSQISNFASGIINGFKSAFKINSPSKIMRDIIGKGIVEGIGVGIDNEEDSLLTKADKLAGSVVDVMSGNIATTNLLNTAKNLTTSMNIATNQATGQDSKINKFDSLLHVENLTINDDKDVETLANDIAFYLKRKNVLTV